MKDAREAGVADLRVTVDGNDLEVEFCAAMDDLVGFLGEPRTRAQREVLGKVEERLNEFERLFVLPAAAGCRVQRVELDLPWVQKPGEGGERGHGDPHAHGHGQDHGHHDHHGPGHEDHDHSRHPQGHAHHDDHEDEEEIPAEVHAAYRVRCTGADALDVMEVRVFNSFPRVGKVRARTENPQGESTVVLDRERRVLKVKGGG